MTYNHYYQEKTRNDLSMRIQCELCELGKTLGLLIKKICMKIGKGQVKVIKILCCLPMLVVHHC